LAKLKAFLTVLLIGGLVYVAVTHLDARLMAELFRTMAPSQMVAIAVLPIGFVLFKAVRFTVLLAPRTDRGRLTAIYGYFASQAVSSFPTGIAGRAAVLKNSGLPFGRITVPLITDSFFDLAFLATSTLLVAALVPAFRSPIYLAVPLTVCLAPLALVGPLHRKVKRVTFALAKRFGKVDPWKNLSRSVRRLKSRRRLLTCAALTILANLTNLFALSCSVRAFQLEVPWITLLIAMTVPALLGRIIFLPGSGTGVVAAGMATILVHSAGLTANQGAAVSIVYRIIDMGLPTLYGWLLLLLVRSPGGECSPPISLLSKQVLQ
jgi:uncharacterized membrane protein YbhN (UPF0104 family)